MYEFQYFEWLEAYEINMMVIKEFRMQKNCYDFDGVGTNYTLIALFVNIINWNGFPFKGDETRVLSILSSIQLTVFAEQTVREVFKSSAYKK
jgi:hypothetical protein